jgi:predicted transcriptional regulator
LIEKGNSGQQAFTDFITIHLTILSPDVAKNMKRQPASFKNRSRLEILYDIVNSAREQPCLKNTILHKSRLSYWQLGRFLDYILLQGLLEERILDESRVYIVTTKGFKFLKAYEELRDVIAANGDKESHQLMETNQH